MDKPPPNWTNWNGPLTLATNHIVDRFISDTIGVTALPHHTLLIAQLSPRLPIPVFRNLFFGPKKPFLTGFLRISFFSCVFQRYFSQEHGFGGVAGIPVFFCFFRNFLRRNSCGTGIPEFTPDSSGIWRIPPDSCSRQLLSG
jgi:hypothetical protein